MRGWLWRLLCRLGLCREPEVHYIGGSDTLPPPLSREREAELLGRLACCHDDEESVEYLQRTVENEGGLTFAAEVMRSYIARAVEMLSEYEASDYRTALANLCAYIAERDR